MMGLAQSPAVQAATITVQPPAAEDWARADLYGLIANLMMAPPEYHLLRELRQSEAVRDTDAHGTPMGVVWDALTQAARAENDPQIKDEFVAMFEAVGRPDVFQHGSFYLSGFLHEKPLADLRQWLQAHGLSRQPEVSETEDHVSALCETMRLLILSDDPRLASLAVQADFFNRFLSPWVGEWAQQIQQHPAARFYRAAAALADQFFDIERESFAFGHG